MQVLLGILLWCVASYAAAHKPSDSYLTLQVGGERVAVQWDIALRDLDLALGLDADGDDRITWGELRARHEAIETYALARLRVEADGAVCPAGGVTHLVDQHSDGGYAVLRFDARCPAAPARLALRYVLLFDLDAQHKGLVQVTSEGRTFSRVFSEDSRTVEIALGDGASGTASAFLSYVREGIVHIAIGFDHVLFLVSLLLPAVLVRRDGRWHPADGARAAAIDVGKVVTAFTAAHSLTLTAATLGAVSLPSRWVESAIAASVVIVALDNLRPMLPLARWHAAFLFGLVHGLGFASVLGDLGLPPGALALSLLGFNLGVELGQLAIVAAFLPLAWTMRAGRVYRQGVFAAGSVGVAAVATTWFVERAFDVKVFG